VVTARLQGGVATADVIVSARVGDNAELFAQILALHVPRGSLVADVTFGLGAFWKKVPAGAYRVLASDIALKPEVRAPEGFSLQTGVDCRALPHADASLDALVLDPPYMEGLYRREVGHMAGSGTHAAFRRAYSQSAPTEDGPRWHDAVVDLYARAGREAAPGAASGRRADRQVSGRGQRQHPAPHPRRADHRLRVARPVLQGPVRAGARQQPRRSRGSRPRSTRARTTATSSCSPGDAPATAAPAASPERLDPPGPTPAARK
jgi:hypothetical protein